MLRKSEKGWIFTEERVLEDFLWLHLESSLDLVPLKRQFTIKGEYCDILAKTRNGQLVVLELKNCEDRYIVHQLTRYYHGLFTEKPFKDSIDYKVIWDMKEARSISSIYQITIVNPVCHWQHEQSRSDHQSHDTK